MQEDIFELDKHFKKNYNLLVKCMQTKAPFDIKKYAEEVAKTVLFNTDRLGVFPELNFQTSDRVIDGSKNVNLTIVKGKNNNERIATIPVPNGVDKAVFERTVLGLLFDETFGVNVESPKLDFQYRAKLERFTNDRDDKSLMACDALKEVDRRNAQKNSKVLYRLVRNLDDDCFIVSCITSSPEQKQKLEAYYAKQTAVIRKSIIEKHPNYSSMLGLVSDTAYQPSGNALQQIRIIKNGTPSQGQQTGPVSPTQIRLVSRSSAGSYSSAQDNETNKEVEEWFTWLLDSNLFLPPNKVNELKTRADELKTRQPRPDSFYVIEALLLACNKAEAKKLFFAFMQNPSCKANPSKAVVLFSKLLLLVREKQLQVYNNPTSFKRQVVRYNKDTLAYTLFENETNTILKDAMMNVINGYQLDAKDVLRIKKIPVCMNDNGLNQIGFERQIDDLVVKYRLRELTLSKYRLGELGRAGGRGLIDFTNYLCFCPNDATDQNVYPIDGDICIEQCQPIGTAKNSWRIYTPNANQMAPQYKQIVARNDDLPIKLVIQTEGYGPNGQRRISVNGTKLLVNTVMVNNVCYAVLNIKTGKISSSLLARTHQVGDCYVFFVQPNKLLIDNNQGALNNYDGYSNVFFNEPNSNMCRLAPRIAYDALYDNNSLDNPNIEIIPLEQDIDGYAHVRIYNKEFHFKLDDNGQYKMHYQWYKNDNHPVAGGNYTGVSLIIRDDLDKHDKVVGPFVFTPFNQNGVLKVRIPIRVFDRQNHFTNVDAAQDVNDPHLTLRSIEGLTYDPQCRKKINYPYAGNNRSLPINNDRPTRLNLNVAGDDVAYDVPS